MPKRIKVKLIPIIVLLHETIARGKGEAVARMYNYDLSVLLHHHQFFTKDPVCTSLGCVSCSQLQQCMTGKIPNKQYWRKVQGRLSLIL